MINSNKTFGQNFESKNDREDRSFNTESENRELFKSALSEALENKFNLIVEAQSDSKVRSPSKRHKIRMNRLFREQVGGDFIPFPEADNYYERIHNKLVMKLKMKKIIVRIKSTNRQKNN